MAKCKRIFDVAINFASGGYGPYTLSNIEAKDFDDIVAKFLSNVEYSRTGRTPKSGDSSGITAKITESISVPGMDAPARAEFTADRDMILHDLEMHGLDWFREKASLSGENDSFGIKADADGYDLNEWPEDCTHMYALLGYDHAGLQRGDVVEVEIKPDGYADGRGVDTDVTGKFNISMQELQNPEKFIPFLAI